VGSDDAEDCAADVFAVAWRRLAQMPGNETSRAWLYGVAYRVVGNQYRSRRRRAKLGLRVASIGGAAGQAGSDPDYRAGLVVLALEQLRPSDQELLRLSVWDGLSRREIASILGIKENAVDQRLHRARLRLKARFDALNGVHRRLDLEEASS
jgi:RNA polymerase sigma-70 factor, ECF subfamily